MAMQYLRDGAASGFLKIILMGFLVLAVGGLVLTDVGGFFRGGISASDAIKVGDHKIGIQTFDRAMRIEAAQRNMTPNQFYQYGLIQELFNQLISQSMMRQLAMDNGIAIGKDYLSARVLEMVKPYMQEEQTPQDVLEQLLRNQGMSEGQFLQSLQDNVAVEILNRGLQAGFASLSEPMLHDLYAAENQSRSFEFLNLPNDQITVSEKPSDEALQELYERTKNTYAVPETRNISILLLNLHDLGKDVKISEQDVLSYYDDHRVDFEVPAKREISQALVQSEEMAQEIYQQAQNGELKTATTEVTGGERDYIAPSSFAKNSLIPAMQEAVFGAKPQSLLEPVRSPLGWHVIYVHKEHLPYTKSFDAVKNEIEIQLSQERLEDLRYDMIAQFDEMLLDEIVFEEIQNTLPTEMIKAQKMRQLNPQNDALRASFDDSAIALIAEKAFELETGQQSDILELESGEILSLRVDDTTPLSFKSYEDVRNAVESQWRKNEIAQRNREKALELKGRLEKGEISLTQAAQQNSLVLQKIEDLNAKKELPAPIQPRSANIIFNIEPQSYALIETSNGIGIINVTEVNYPAPREQDLEEFKKQRVFFAQSEAVSTYLNAKRDGFKPQINAALLEQVYGQSE